MCGTEQKFDLGTYMTFGFVQFPFTNAPTHTTSVRGSITDHGYCTVYAVSVHAPLSSIFQVLVYERVEVIIDCKKTR